MKNKSARTVRTFAFCLLPFALLPVYVAQGLWTRRRTPRLPDATGPTTGLVNGTSSTAATFNLVVLGESTVAGIGAATHSIALTGQTARAVSELTGCAVSWHAVGLSGATAARAIAELLPQLPQVEADAAVIALGVNDTIKLHSPQHWRRDLIVLLDGMRAKLGRNVPVVLAGVPPLGEFPALPQPLRRFMGARAALLDSVSEKLAAELPRVRHVPFPRLPAPEEFAPDGFHPGPKAYADWGRWLGVEIVGLTNNAEAHTE